MTDPSLGRKKRKITYTASSQGIEIAEKALKRLGFESKINFAKSQLLARSTVTKFFQSEPIQLDSLQRICEALKLNWREIAGIKEELSERLEIKDCISSNTNEGVEQVQTLRRQVTVIDKQSKKIKADLVLEGDLNSVNNDLLVALELVLRNFSGDTIKITNIKEGSIRLILEGSQEDIERLVSRIKSGELTELSGFPVEDIQILSESLDDESNELDDKWHLVQEIVSQAVKGRNLSGADLSGADLSGADLSGANLIFADLSGADLSGADLSGANVIQANWSDADLSGANLSGVNVIFADLSSANLSGADLSGANVIQANWSDANLMGANLMGADLMGANLMGADLTGANLMGANLINAFLNDAKVENARFGDNLGISESMKCDLIERGAVFEGSPGERSGVLTPF